MSHPVKAPSGDQASRLRELVRKQTRSALVLAIISGKGGVGKTNVAVNLSICLSSHSMKVTLVDVDLGLANADLLMDLHSQYTLAHVLTGHKTIEEITTPGPAGIRFIAGASGIPESANLSDFERENLIYQLHKLETSTDIVVLDCGAGISKNVLGFAQHADQVLVVTTPQPTALTDAYAAIKSLHRLNCPGQVGLIVNMTTSRAEAEATYRRLAQVSRKFLNFSVADFGFLLQDTVVEAAVRQRCPFVVGYPQSNAAACIASIAGRFIQLRSGAESRGGFFRRVGGLFI
ncbi:MAG: MinD/ParA family protein [Planctomycetota bacterium]